MYTSKIVSLHDKVYVIAAWEKWRDCVPHSCKCTPGRWLHSLSLVTWKIEN